MLVKCNFTPSVMKKLIAIILLGGLLWGGFSNRKVSDRELYGQFLNSHEYNNKHYSPKQLKAIPKKDRPDLAWEQDYIMTMDPALGRPAPERLKAIYNKVDQDIQLHKSKAAIPGSTQYPWEERGPDNVGGRTRAIMFDPNDATNKKVWAGGVTGGLWYNNDITNANSQWVAQNDFWENLSITCMAYDPTNPNIFYVGTGEGWGSSVSGARGAGVWKTTDGGLTFIQLAATSNFYFVNDLAVRDENGNGVLYVGLREVYYNFTFHGSGSEGLQRSTDGGQTFSQVLPNVPGQSFNYAVADIDIASDNRIWVGTINSGNFGSDRGGGRVLYSDNGTSWTSAYNNSSGGRVRVAAAPSDSSYIYAIVEESSEVGEIIRTTDHGSTWNNLNEPDDADFGIPSTDFSRGQAWVHLALAVDPNNKNVVYAGSVDLFKTTDGGTNWDQLSHWYGGFGFPYVHADNHIVAFRPGSTSEALFGNDGGAHWSSNLGTTSPSFSEHNNGYNITQFYACAIHPNSGSDYFLAGSQDNGTHQFTTPGINSTAEVTGGDGAYCFIDQTDPTYQITSYVYNSYYLSDDGGLSFPTNMQNDFNTGRFINPADYDDNQDVLYSARNSTSINRITNISTVPSVSDFTVSGLGATASNLKVSPYTTSSTTLFVGSGNGNLFKITNAEGASPTATNIGSGSFPNGYISSIDIGSSEQEILVTFSNYGVTSVWYTNNGGTNWISKEGNLPDMPIRWCLFNPLNYQEVILATEVGIWQTSDITASNVNWTSSISGLAKVKITMLQHRTSDNLVAAATFGRGLYTSNGFTSGLAPVAGFDVNQNSFCTLDTLKLSDTSQYVPNSWNWTFNPNTVSFVNGTSASSQNPEVIFNASGNYTVTLDASNSNGNDQTSMQVQANILPTPTISRLVDILSCNENGFTYQWYKNGNLMPGETNQTLQLTANGNYHVEIGSAGCKMKSAVLAFNSIGLVKNVATEFRFYPNPVRDQLYLEFAPPLSAKLIYYELYNTLGQLVWKDQNQANQSKIRKRINLGEFPSGNYVLKIRSGEWAIAKNIQKL